MRIKGLDFSIKHIHTSNIPNEVYDRWLVTNQKRDNSFYWILTVERDEGTDDLPTNVLCINKNKYIIMKSLLYFMESYIQAGYTDAEGMPLVTFCEHSKRTVAEHIDNYTKTESH